MTAVTDSGRIRRVCCRCVVYVYAVVCTAMLTVSAEAAEVTILFTNNSNGKITACNCPRDPWGGLAERVAFIRERRRAGGDFLLLDSGGFFGLSAIGRYGPVTAHLMAEMGYDAVGVGDQELYHTLARFLVLSEPLAGVLTNASVHRIDGSPVFAPWRVFEAGGIRVGVIGISGHPTFRFFPGERRDFVEVAADSSLAAHLPELERAADVIVVLSQMGIEEDVKLAGRWPAIDLVIGGHSQTLVWQAREAGNAAIVQAGRNGGYVGEVRITVPAAGGDPGIVYSLMPVDETYVIPDDIRGYLQSHDIPLETE